MSIDVNNVSKSFITKDKDFTAVKDINLHVDDGEFICLLGPSGCFRLWKNNSFKDDWWIGDSR